MAINLSPPFHQTLTGCIPSLSPCRSLASGTVQPAVTSTSEKARLLGMPVSCTTNCAHCSSHGIRLATLWSRRSLGGPFFRTTVGIVTGAHPSSQFRITWTPRSSQSLGRPFSCTRNCAHFSNYSPFDYLNPEEQPVRRWPGLLHQEFVRTAPVIRLATLRSSRSLGRPVSCTRNCSRYSPL